MGILENRRNKHEENLRKLRLQADRARELKRKGCTNTQIAHELGIPESSVRTILKSTERR